MPHKPIPGRVRPMPGGHDLSDLSALAATRAALDPHRRAWRSDVLISAIVEVLARKGPRRTSELRAELRHIWVATTASADTRAVEEACELARAAGLLLREQRVHPEPTWRVTDQAKMEVATDREWARDLLQRFGRSVQERLETELDEPVEPARIPRLAKQLIRAMVKASEGVLRAVADSGRPESLREVKLNLAAVARTLADDVHPASLAQAVAGLALAAADPADDFGDEMLRLIVTGQVLHGMATRADLTTAPATAVTLLTDTSVLVDFLGREPDAEKLLRQLIAESNAAGHTVAVTEEVLGEWDRVWEAAALQVAAWSAGLKDLSGRSWMHANNPVVAAWLYRRQTEHNLTFAGFAGKWRDLRHRLESLGLQLLESPEADPDVESGVRLWLEQNARRSPRRAAVDAASAAQVAALRRQRRGPAVPSAWFLAKDRATGDAYRSASPEDEYPVAVSPAAWLLYLQSWRPAGSEGRQQLAEAVGSAVILEAFLSVAAGYTLDDLLRVSDLLHAAELSEEDLKDAVRASFLDLQGDATEQAKVEAFAVRRVQRRDRRATDALAMAEQRSRDRIAQAEADVAAAERREEEAAARRQEERMQDAARAAGSEATQRRRSERFRRERNVAALGLLVALGVTAFILWGPLPVIAQWLLAVSAAAAIAVGGLEYIRSEDPHPVRIAVWSTLGAALVTAAGTLAGTAAAQKQRDDPEPAPVNSNAVIPDPTPGAQTPGGQPLPRPKPTRRPRSTNDPGDG